jgi:DNA-binding NarL/FixJ family response regulator
MIAEARLNEEERVSSVGPSDRELIRDCIELDARGRAAYCLSKLWADLTEGRSTIVECFFTEARCFIVTTPHPRAPRPDRRLLPRKVRVLDRILLGEGQKAVALALRVAPSTVTLISGECLRAMGLDCRSSRVPMALVMAAHAHANPNTPSSRDGRVTDVVRNGRALRIVSAPRPDRALHELLSPAECAVARLLIEGKRHVEIAALRETSTRTIANQLAAAFHKLRVSGRAELLSRLVQNLQLAALEETETTPVSVLPAPVSRRPDSQTRSAESLPAA